MDTGRYKYNQSQFVIHINDLTNTTLNLTGSRGGVAASGSSEAIHNYVCESIFIKARS